MSNTPKLKKYHVHCVVTRGEWYEIMASDEATARNEAFCEGKFIEAGEAYNVTECDAEEVRS